MRRIELDAARRMAVSAALLGGPPLAPTAESVMQVARHFGGVQIDPTRTVERTQYLVLWSRIRDFRRALLDQLLGQHQLFEWNAFIVGPERLPELFYVARSWPTGGGNWRERARRFFEENAAFRQSIVEQLRARGPLQSRQIDDSQLKVGWESSGWTHGRNTSRMLEFMSLKMEVAVAGRIGPERLWDVPERVIPSDAPRNELTDDEYQQRRVMRAMERFGVASLPEIRLRAYGLSIPAAKELLARMVSDGRLEAVRLERLDGEVDAFALPRLVAAADVPATRTTLLSPFDPLVYDRDRTERLFGFRYKLEMYVPKEQRRFGHYVLPVLHHDRLVGRLDAQMDRRADVLRVNGLHWETPPDAGMVEAVDSAVADMAAWLGASSVVDAR